LFLKLITAYIFVMYMSWCGLSPVGYNRYNYSENEPKTAVICSPVLTSICITLEYSTMIHSDSLFDLKAILVKNSLPDASMCHL